MSCRADLHAPDTMVGARRSGVTALVYVFAGLLAASVLSPADAGAEQTGVALKPCRVKGVKEELRCGVAAVPENRRTREGRMLPLKIVVIPARRPHPEHGPVFYLAGGPGETATELVDHIIEMGDHEEHDVVLVDQRGTGDGHRLDCRSPGSDDNLAAYLNGPFDPAAARVCAEELGRKYDLAQYSTPNFVEDLEDVRRALRYDKINLSAGSFGTYAALIYMRRYPQHVRSAYLRSLTPPADRVPLYFAEAAQLALEALFDQCKQDPACHAAYPRLRANFAALLEKVRAGPVATAVARPVTGAREEIQLSERAFADGLRVIMYRAATAYEIPFFIEQAIAGDFTPFAEAALRASRGIYAGGRMGLHYAVTCSEFVSRIRPEEVEPATRGTFLGAWRVRDQIAACEQWPRTELPADHFEVFEVDVPALVVSGAADPAGSHRRISKEVELSLRKAIHVVVPGVGHIPDNECTRTLRHRLFRDGTTDRLETQCVAQVPRPAFKLPAKSDT